MGYDSNIIKQNTDFLNSTLKDIQYAHKKAERKFDDEKDKIEKMTAATINIYYDNPHSKIVQAVHASMEASKELFATCQALVVSLDDLCRPRLSLGASASVINEIACEIESLNEDSIIDNDYTGSLDGISFGDVAKVSFTPTIEARAIETFWRAKANEFALHEKAVLKKQKDEQFIKQHKINPGDLEKHRLYLSGKEMYQEANTSEKMLKVENIFKSLSTYLDSPDFAKKCAD